MPRWEESLKENFYFIFLILKKICIARKCRLSEIALNIILNVGL